MRKHDFNNPFSQPAPAVPGCDNHVAEISKCGMIGDGSSETNLLAACKESEANRVLDRFCDLFTQTALGPISLLQERRDHIKIEPRPIIGHQILAARPFHRVRLHEKLPISQRQLEGTHFRLNSLTSDLNTITVERNGVGTFSRRKSADCAPFAPDNCAQQAASR